MYWQIQTCVKGYILPYLDKIYCRHLMKSKIRLRKHNIFCSCLSQNTDFFLLKMKLQTRTPTHTLQKCSTFIYIDSYTDVVTVYYCTVMGLTVGWSAVQKLSVNKTSIASCMCSEQLSSQNNSNLYSFQRSRFMRVIL